MTEKQFHGLRLAIMQARSLLDTTRFTLRELENAFSAIACKECGGSGCVDVSREPCSTAMCDCQKCDGKGFVP
jgi:excinuclease UvrABC ATPase subunit